MDESEELARLLLEARSGNEAALAALLDRLRDRVRGCAQARLGQRLGARVDSSDIAQDVLRLAWERFGQFQGASVGQLLVWLDQILENHITDCRRRHGAGKRDADAEVPGADLFPALAADGTTPSQGAIRNERQGRLDDALRRLPERQRQVVRLRIYEGLSFEEVARRVGVTVTNARVLMVRATERLRNELGDEHE